MHRRNRTLQRCGRPYARTMLVAACSHGFDSPPPPDHPDLDLGQAGPEALAGDRVRPAGRPCGDDRRAGPSACRARVAVASPPSLRRFVDVDGKRLDATGYAPRRGAMCTSAPIARKCNVVLLAVKEAWTLQDGCCRNGGGATPGAERRPALLRNCRSAMNTSSPHGDLALSCLDRWWRDDELRRLLMQARAVGQSSAGHHR
jgi:hypothetical protein